MVGDSTEPNSLPISGNQLSLLTYVLRYDDLLAGEDRTFIILDEVSTLRIGRAESGSGHALQGRDSLHIDDSLVSSHHAELLAKKDKVLIVDHGSRNGTFVNGARIQERVLADGDLIEIGRSLLCYRRTDAQLGRTLADSAAPHFLGPVRTHSPEVLQLSRNLRAIAPTRESVLILGETGTGKEIVAATLHAQSGRSGALRVIDCGAIPESLFESELFGHRRGAFTGAIETHVGEIVRAQHGTLFLDEVANMSMSAQAKLLRVLEDGQVTAVGATKKESLDVRWIAATNVDLFESPSFRYDVLQRLTGFVAWLPPLRERREDLGALTAHLLQKAGVTRAAMTVAAGRQFYNGKFAGNIRQLRNELRSATALAGERPIELCHLPSDATRGASRLPESARSHPSGLTPQAPSSAPAAQNTQSAQGPHSAQSPLWPQPGNVATHTRTPPDIAQISSALTSTQGNVVRAAGLLQTHPKQLYRWLDRLKIPLKQFRKS